MRRAAGSAWIACWLLCMYAEVACAQSSAETSAGASENDDHDASAGPSAALFLLPAVDPETEARLRDALLAQFAVVDVRLIFEASAPIEHDANERVVAMQARAGVHAALAAFSIDARADGRWTLYMLDVARQRLLVRTLDAGPERRAAAIEAVALVTREATRAVLEGVPMPDPPPEPPAPQPAHSAPPPVAVEPPPPPQVTGVPTVRHQSAGALRLWLAYDGTDFADEVAPRHCAAVGVGWLGFEPWYVALSAEFGVPIDVRDSVELPGTVPVEQTVAFTVTRLPLLVHFGHRYQQERVVLDLEAAVTAELLHRSSDRNLPAQDGVRIQPTDSESTNWLVGLGPRARVEYQFLSWAGLAAELGFDALLNANHFGYLARTPAGDRTLVHPLAVRPIWSLGVAFYP
jgi:hypothetical protein